MIPVRDTIPSRNRPFATWCIVAATVFMFFFVELPLEPKDLEQLFYRLGIVPARDSHPEWASWFGLADDYWPFLTSMFLHGGFAHLVGNMWALWIFGDNVEDRMGPFRFSLFYVACGLVAGVVHGLTNPSSTVPTVGASGAIAGVMGAYLVLFPRARIIAFLPMFFVPWFFAVPAVLYLGLWAATQVLSGTMSLVGPADVGGIAWWAHVGGFATGLILHPLFLSRERSGRRRWSPDEWGVEGAWHPMAGRSPKGR